MSNAETVRKLICCAFASATPDDLDLTLYSCLGLYSQMLASEYAIDTVAAAASVPPSVLSSVPESPADALDGNPGFSEYQPTPISGAKAAAIFKRKVHERLVAYRQANGVGSFGPLAEAIGGSMSTDTLSRMLVGEKLGVECWREVDKALDMLEAKSTKE